MGKIHYLMNKGTKYVYTTKPRHRLSNGKLSKDIRIYYGKYKDDIFYPNKTYQLLSKKEKLALGLEKEPEESLIEKAIQEHVKKEQQKATPLPSAIEEFPRRRIYGSNYIMEIAAKNSQIEKILREAFHKDFYGVLIFCFFLCSEFHQSIDSFDNWMSTTCNGFSKTMFLEDIIKNIKLNYTKRLNEFYAYWKIFSSREETRQINFISLLSTNRAINAIRYRNFDSSELQNNEIYFTLGYSAISKIPNSIHRQKGFTKKQREAMEESDKTNKIAFFFDSFFEVIGSKWIEEDKEKILDKATFLSFISLIICNELDRAIQLAIKENGPHSLLQGYTVASLLKEFKKVEAYELLDGTIKVGRISTKHHLMLKELGYPDLVEFSEINFEDTLWTR